MRSGRTAWSTSRELVSRAGPQMPAPRGRASQLSRQLALRVQPPRRVVDPAKRPGHYGHPLHFARRSGRLPSKKFRSEAARTGIGTLSRPPHRRRKMMRAMNVLRAPGLGREEENAGRMRVCWVVCGIWKTDGCNSTLMKTAGFGNQLDSQFAPNSSTKASAAVSS